MKAEIRKTVGALAAISTEEALRRAHTCPPPDRQGVVGLHPRVPSGVRLHAAHRLGQTDRRSGTRGRFQPRHDLQPRLQGSLQPLALRVPPAEQRNIARFRLHVTFTRLTDEVSRFFSKIFVNIKYFLYICSVLAFGKRLASDGARLHKGDHCLRFSPKQALRWLVLGTPNERKTNINNSVY